MVGAQAEGVGAVGEGGERPLGAPAGHLAQRDAVAALHHRGGVDGRVGEGAGGDEVVGAPVHLAGGAELRDPPLVHRRRPSAQEQRLGRLGGGVDHGALPAREEPGQLVAQPLAQLVVEVGERLVEQHQPRLLHQRPRQGGALLLPAGELGRAPVEERGEPEQLGDAPHARLHLGRRHPGHPQRRGDVLTHREVGVVDELLVDHGHPPLAHRHAGDVPPLPQHAPGGGPEEPRHEAHERGLPGQGGAEQDVEARGRQRQAGGVHVRLGADAQLDVLEGEAHGVNGGPGAAGCGFLGARALGYGSR